MVRGATSRSTRSSVALLASVLTPIIAIGPSGVAAPPEFEEWTTFQFPQPLAPTRLELVDLDGDGHLDAVCPGRNSAGRAYLLRGDGAGGFTDPIELSVGAQTDWVEAADVDGDGVVDLVFAVRSGQGRVAILRGLGGFDFAPPIFVTTGRETRAVAIGAANGQGERTIVAMQNGESSLRGVTRDSQGEWSASPRRTLGHWVGSLPMPQWMETADADGDGVPDFWCSVNGAGLVSLVRGAGGASFGRTTEWRAPLVQGENPGLLLGAVADIDGNGTKDMIVAGLPLAAQQSVLLFLNDGTGDLSDRRVVSVTNQGLAWSVSAADLDLDGDIDLVFTTALPGSVRILENRSSGGVIQFTKTLAFANGEFLRHVRIGDLDGDCRPDLVVADFTGNRLEVLRNITPGIGCGGGVAGEGRSIDRSAGELRVRRERSESDAAMARALRREVAAAGSDAVAIAEALASFPRWDDGAHVFAPEQGTRATSSAQGGLADGFPACGPPAGACNEPHGGLGCFTPACCKAVCAFEPACCESAWDEYCVFLAQIECVGLICPSPGSCYEPHPTRGCDDEECCGRVGRLDPFCRTTAWDELCVIQAQLFCDLPACALPPPPPESLPEEEPCYKRLNQGCTPLANGVAEWLSLDCDSKWHGTISTTSPRDTDWMRLELAEPRRVRLEVRGEFPLRLFLLKGSCDGAMHTIEDRAAIDCNAVVIERCLEPGLYHAVIGIGIADRLISSGQPCDEVDPDAPPPGPDEPPFVPGYFGLDWRASLLCGVGALTGDYNGDGVVDGSDLGTLLGFWGPNPEGDLDCDGTVDGADLGILLGNWAG